MRHIAVTLMMDGKSAGPARALCGAMVAVASGRGEVCPRCREIDEREKGS